MQARDARVLVVEDDAALRMLCRVNLELDGFDVREAATLAEADAALADGDPDVVFLDVHLQGTITHDFLHRLRAAGIPVAVVSGSTDLDTYRDEADAVLAKPFQPLELVAIARRLARVGADE